MDAPTVTESRAPARQDDNQDDTQDEGPNEPAGAA